MRKEGRCGQDDHGRVDCPAHAHRKERVEELIAQTLFDNLLALAFEVHGLDDLGVQKEVVGHNDRAQDTHDNRGRAGGHAGRNPACGGLRPVDLDQRKLGQKRESYHAHEGNDPPLGALVGARHEHRHRCRRHDDAACAHGQPKEHLKGNRATQDFGHGGGDGREIGTGEHRAPDEAGEVTCRGLGKTGARGDTQVRRIVLQHNEHNRGQCDDPQQRVAKLRARGHIGGPVARVDKADGHEQPGADMPRNV